MAAFCVAVASRICRIWMRPLNVYCLVCRQLVRTASARSWCFCVALHFNLHATSHTNGWHLSTPTVQCQVEAWRSTLTDASSGNMHHQQVQCPCRGLVVASTLPCNCQAVLVSLLSQCDAAFARSACTGQGQMESQNEASPRTFKRWAGTL